MADKPTETNSTFEEVESIVIRFAGDSGDGMQLTGTQFGNASAVFGNDISTLPDFPAEIRAPVGTLAGVSGYQVNFSSQDILTPGDCPDVLVAMNPAALKASLPYLEVGGTIIVNVDSFTPGNIAKANFSGDPLEDGTLKNFTVYKIPISTLNHHALAHLEGMAAKDRERCQNFFALGLAFWLYDRPLEVSLKWIEEKFARRPLLAQANQAALQAGYDYGHNTDIFQVRFHVKRANLPPGTYRRVTGNSATALGLVTAAQKAGKPLFYGSYPITPASEILHYLADLKNFDVRTFQAEDEIAAMGSVIGAAFGGAFAATGTSGPGMALKSEAINLAIVLELPMVIVNVQRGGPSTGMPTKPEQSDLLQALFGRNGESPIPVLAAATPADCFYMAIEAFRLAVRISSPVILLSDGFLANSAEPWSIPNPKDIPPIAVEHPTHSNNGEGKFLPYKRTETMGRPWAIPGAPGLEHRIGGLAKQPNTGNVSYDPADNEQMITERAKKVVGLAAYIPEQEVYGPTRGDLLVISWGSSFGAVRSAVQNLHTEGRTVSHAHLRYLNPLPRNLGELISQFERILIPEMNRGQLSVVLKNHFLIKNLSGYYKVQGRPFTIREIQKHIAQLLAED